jgi:hypothetical protein
MRRCVRRNSLNCHVKDNIKPKLASKLTSHDIMIVRRGQIVRVIVIAWIRSVYSLMKLLSTRKGNFVRVVFSVPSRIEEILRRCIVEVSQR